MSEPAWSLTSDTLWLVYPALVFKVASTQVYLITYKTSVSYKNIPAFYYSPCIYHNRSNTLGTVSACTKFLKSKFNTLWKKNAYFGFLFQDFRGENNQIFNHKHWCFPGSSVVKALCFQGRGAHWIPRQGAKISHVAWPKKYYKKKP